MTADAAQEEMRRPDPTKVRFLTPDMCRIHLGTHGALHVTVAEERIYGGVYAAFAFPVAHPESYISLIHTADGEGLEIGIIRDLNDFPEEQAALVRQALARRYFIHIVHRIRQIGNMKLQIWQIMLLGVSGGSVC